jgi:hypothetical protein
MNKIVTIERNSGNTYIGEYPEYKVASVINELLKQLASKPFIFRRSQRMPPAATIVKIKHNQIQSKSHVIKQYLDHSAAIESAYIDIDSIVAFGKEIILQNLSDLYFAALDELNIEYILGCLDVAAVRDNSEFILDFIIQKLKNSVYESSNVPGLKEQIDRGVNVVVAHAFIECVIFENPGNDT